MQETCCKITPDSRGGPSRETGSAAVELAIIIILLMVIAMGVVDYGLTLRDTLQAGEAAASAARAAAEFVKDSADKTAACSCAGLRNKIESWLYLNAHGGSLLGRISNYDIHPTIETLPVTEGPGIFQNRRYIRVAIHRKQGSCIACFNNYVPILPRIDSYGISRLDDACPINTCS